MVPSPDQGHEPADHADVRSFRTVFELERRIYRIDRLRLNPAGIPVRGGVYFLVLVVGLLVLGKLPVLGWPVAELPWYVRDLALPGALAGMLTIVRVEGRPFHVAAGSLCRFAIGERQLCRFSRCPAPGAQWLPPSLLVVPDGSEGRWRDFRFRGPGAVLALRSHRPIGGSAGSLARFLRQPDVILREAPGARFQQPGKVVVLEAGGRLEVRGRRGGRLGQTRRRSTRQEHAHSRGRA